SILPGCAALGSVYTVSRSSGDSGTATMKDFIAPQKVNIDNCGKIVVKKVTDPSPDATDTSFSFTAGGGLSPTSFSLKNGETKEFPGVNPGNGYNVAETVPSGWDLTSATCDDGSPVTNIDVGTGETVTCTFTNRLKGEAEVIKTFSRLPERAGQWVTFQLGSGAWAPRASAHLEGSTAYAGVAGAH